VAVVGETCQRNTVFDIMMLSSSGLGSAIGKYAAPFTRRKSRVAILQTNARCGTPSIQLRQSRSSSNGFGTSFSTSSIRQPLCRDLDPTPRDVRPHADMLFDYCDVSGHGPVSNNCKGLSLRSFHLILRAACYRDRVTASMSCN
jgi:hypothetical protein